MKKSISCILTLTFSLNISFAQNNNDSIPSDTTIYKKYNLDELIINADRSLVTVELDKISYNLVRDAESKTSTVLDMLKKVPMVTVDANNKISLKGSSDFVVYLNGKPSGIFTNNPEEALRNMPANTVKDIEVITDPGARYDAEGVSGIINIVTISQTYLNGFTTTIKAGLNSQGGGDAGLFIMAKKGKIGFTGSLNSYRYRYPDSDINKTGDDFINNNTVFEEGYMNIKGYGLWGSGELSFEIDSLNLINIGYNTHHGKENWLWDGYISQTQASNLIYTCDRLGKEHGTWGGSDVNFDYQNTSAKNPERRFTFSYRYSYSPRNSESKNIYFNPNPVDDFPAHILLDSTKQYTNARTNEHTFQLDYSTPLGKIHSLETGVKYILRLNKSNSDYLIFNEIEGWLPLYSQGDEHSNITLFKHSNNIIAAYGSYALKLKKWGLRAGLRYEYTLLNVDFERNTNLNFNNNYDNFVPSIMGSYQINDAQNMRLSYNMRLNRPGIWQLNPYIDDSNPNFISKGNPNLDAVLTHSVSLNYGFFNPKINVNANLSYDFTNNSIENITHIEDGTSISNYENIGEKQDTKLMLYINWTPNEKFKLYSNLGGSYVDIRANDGSLPNRYFFSGWIYSGVDYRLPWKIWLSGGIGGGSPHKTLQTTNGRSWWHQLSLKRDFFKDKMNVRIYANNPFAKKFNIKSTVENTNFYQETNLVLRPREFGFVISFRIGELKAQLKKTAKSITNDDLIKQNQGDGQ
jgi:outer membrane receptor protein involved in Fe transport